jgi:beta-N-acetylhexosaminidase
VKRLLAIALLLMIVSSSLFVFTPVSADNDFQVSPEQEKAEILLKQLTPEEKVGQLFLVTYQSAEVGEDSQIAQLIASQHIGGVILRADNDNFSNTENLPEFTKNSIINLQTINWKSTISGIQTDTGTIQPGGNYVPLFIGVSQEGDLAPYDQIINGLTPLPSAMAIGATWKPENAKAVGKILGAELEAMGFNLLLGPSLDVLDLVKTDIGDDLGTRTFSGDPYWVGQFGKAFTAGVHEGSDNKVLVISKHFPGRGGSDRQPEDEVATVRKSLEQLKQIELYPFFAVTKSGEDLLERTDGLLLSHIRYQGFQGNIRATTRPVSFDETALSAILALEQFAPWRESGGIIICDDLGSNAVQKFFAPTGTNFDARQVAKTALLAGNDLLYLGNLQSTDDITPYQTTVRIHEYFVQKYKEDPVFQQRVDEAVLRSLTLKYKLYPYFSLGVVTVTNTNLNEVGISQQVTLDVAHQAVTLVSPTVQDLNIDLPNPPNPDDQIVFISDEINQSQCSTCEDQSFLLGNELMNAVIRLYGPSAGDIVQVNRLSFYSFDSLKSYLDGIDNQENIGANLDQADWIIIAFSQFKLNSEESVAFQRLFSEKPNLVRNKKIIGFAFSAPYYPDATDISKFTAYYALYSKTPQFIEIAARTLFKEITPTGVLPVSVSSIGYDLINATTPNANQVIPLMVIQESSETGETENSTSNLEEVIVINAGDNLVLQTGIIKDQNGNPVPDGTVVRFVITDLISNATAEQIESQTVTGVARTTYRIPEQGTVQLTVTADPAVVSQILKLEITPGGGTITSIDPTIAPTGAEEVVEATPSISPQMNITDLRHSQGFPGAVDWFIATFVIGVSISALYQFGEGKRKNLWNPWIPTFSGVMGYILYLLPILGNGFSQALIRRNGTIASVGFTIIGCVSGILIALIIRLILRQRKPA